MHKEVLSFASDLYKVVLLLTLKMHKVVIFWAPELHKVMLFWTFNRALWYISGPSTVTMHVVLFLAFLIPLKVLGMVRVGAIVLYWGLDLHLYSPHSQRKRRRRRKSLKSFWAVCTSNIYVAITCVVWTEKKPLIPRTRAATEQSG